MKHIVCMGNPSDGFYFVGPFDDPQHAYEYMGSEKSTHNMWVFDLHEAAPSQEKEKSNDYVDSFGLECPVCESTDITADGPMEQDAGIAWQTVECRACKHSWTDEYELVGFSNLQAP